VDRDNFLITYVLLPVYHVQGTHSTKSELLFL